MHTINNILKTVYLHIISDIKYGGKLNIIKAIAVKIIMVGPEKISNLTPQY